VDNVFIFLLIFQFFRVEPRYQHRLLFYGVLGALILRGVMIGVGAVLIERFDWVLYVFGAFIIYAGFKLFGADHSVHPEKNPVLRWVQKILPVSQTGDGQKLFTRENGRWLATPLFLVVIVLETTDLVFAVDSIPAVFGVTRDPFLVYSSNVCAILGLRAFYFLLAGILPYFRYLDEGLAIVLMFIGAKMLAEPWVRISTAVSLAIVGGVISIAIAVSIFAAKIEEIRRQRASHFPERLLRLADASFEKREAFAQMAFHSLWKRSDWLRRWLEEPDLSALFVRDQFVQPDGKPGSQLRVTI
jgi:tellurite resistance protein TerC